MVNAQQLAARNLNAFLPFTPEEGKVALRKCNRNPHGEGGPDAARGPTLAEQIPVCTDLPSA
jgi:hypothetical protein